MPASPFSEPNRRSADPVGMVPLTFYAHGPSDVPLLGETIGENLRRTVERFGDREAVVVGHQHYRATYRELRLEIDSAARGLLARGSARATASASGRRTASSGW